MSDIIYGFLFVIFIALATSGCATKKQFIATPPPPPTVMPMDYTTAQPCKSPVEVPQRALSQSEGENLWKQDRKNLVECKGKHEAAVAFTEKLSAELQATPKDK